jgi:hypothetical protein
MANYETSSEIISDALFRSAEPIDGSSDYVDQATIWLNRAYRAIYMGGTELDKDINETWWWMQERASLVLQPLYQTGTVNVTINSTAAFFSTAPLDVDSAEFSLSGWYFRVNDKPNVYQIVSHVAGATQFMIDSVYVDPTDATASFKAFKLEYSLASDCIKVLAPMSEYHHRRPIDGVSLETMERKWPLGSIRFGSPTRFAHIDESTIRFNKGWLGGSDNDELSRVDYLYHKRPADLVPDPPAGGGGVSEVNFSDGGNAFPLEYRYILSDFLRALILEDKEDTRTGDAWLQARAGLQAMARENRNRMAKHGNPGAIFPRQSQVHWEGNEPLRTEAGLIIG